MVQVVDGRQKQWVSLDFRGVPNPIAKEGVAPNEVIVLSQLTRALQEEQAARAAERAAANAALATETQARIDGDTLAEQRLATCRWVTSKEKLKFYSDALFLTPQEVILGI